MSTYWSPIVNILATYWPLNVHLLAPYRPPTGLLLDTCAARGLVRNLVCPRKTPSSGRPGGGSVLAVGRGVLPV